jgi:hypothetical protein
MLQHSRIRDTYNIEGSTAGDCCSSLCCPNCTLMQDDREICARERIQTEEKRKHPGPIGHEPTTQPDMQYAAPHRGSLEIESTATLAATQNQDCDTKGPKSEKELYSGHPKHYYGNKKLHKVPKIEINDGKANSKGKNGRINDVSLSSPTGNMSSKNLATTGSAQTLVIKYAKTDPEDQDGILRSKQTGRGQD